MDTGWVPSLYSFFEILLISRRDERKGELSSGKRISGCSDGQDVSRCLASSFEGAVSRVA